MTLAWSQALAWRLHRQLLDPVGTAPVEEVVRRLGGVQAQAGAAGELSTRTRQQRSEAGEVARARADGRLVPADWAVLRGVVRDALADEPLTVKELIAAIAARPAFAHLGPMLADNPWGVMKVHGWHGDLNFDDEIAIEWFAECGEPPRAALEAEVDRLAGILDRPFRLVIGAA